MEKLNKEEFVSTIVNFGLDCLCILVFVRQNMTHKKDRLLTRGLPEFVLVVELIEFFRFACKK